MLKMPGGFSRSASLATVDDPLCVSFITRSSARARDNELAKASRVSNDLDLRDLRVREGEGQRPGQLAARREDQSDRSIDERGLYGSQPSRERDELFRPRRSAPDLPRRGGGVRCRGSDACRGIDANDGVRIEHGEEALEVACTRRLQKRLPHSAL